MQMRMPPAHVSTAMVVILLFVGSSPVTWAHSTADEVTLCDAHSIVSCDSHGLNEDGTEDRLNCTEENRGIMWWAKRPTRNSAYEVTAGQGIIEYSPGGTFMKIYVNVLKYDWVYRA